MLTQHIALVPEAGGVDLSELSRVSAALQKQVTRDLSPLWGISATVDAFHELEDVPVGYWPIVISRGDLLRAAGVHLDRNGQPYAHIALSSLWSVEASRACLEMLISPFGDRTTTAASPRTGQGLVELLVEVCSPCAAASFGYSINGVLVSDFCTPAFFGASASSGCERYSFRGSIAAPFQLLRGGYLTWYEPSQNEWWMRVLPSDTPIDLALGSLEQSSFGARDLVRRRGPARLWSGGASSGAMLVHTRKDRDLSLAASRNRAFRLRSLLGQRLEESLRYALPGGDETAEPALDVDRWANPRVLLAAENPQQVDSADVADDEQAPAEPVTTVYQLRNLEGEEQPLAVAKQTGEQPAPAAAPAAKREDMGPARKVGKTRATNPPPLPTQRVSRPSEAARARRALPAESWSAPARAPRLPSSIPPVEILTTLTPAKERRDGLMIASVALAAAALVGLIWTQRGDVAPSAAARPGLPSPILTAEPKAAQQPAVGQQAVPELRAPQEAPARAPAMRPSPGSLAVPTRAASLDERGKPAQEVHEKRASRQRAQRTPEAALEPVVPPVAEPVPTPSDAEQHASALDKLIDTRR